MLMLGACERPAPTAPAAPAAPQTTSADGVPIRYDTIGYGAPALVFVHCWTCDRSFWDAQATHFAKRYPVVRLDLAGHGASGTARKDYTIEAFSADVAAVVDALALKQVVLIGHSMGGPVSVEAAKRLGDRVIGVVGIDTFYTGFELPKDPKQLDDMTNQMLKPFEENYPDASAKFIRGFFAPGADPALVERVATNAARADKSMALSAMRNIFGWYGQNAPGSLEALGPKLRNINGNPKGDKKPLHPSVVLIDGAHHFPALEKPAEFNRALEEIVKGFTATASAKP
jgi:pimeloyl-ACP methyl ester carboxylesterase